ncbi:hypothetical protein [Micromonospora violae]|uniref:hypothetical protein n=1 Tax=Micromonospora violae TaxID=1278207 RepID=UPI001FC94FF9|nr:hypothetical protein [Micromonospora violae]
MAFFRQARVCGFEPGDRFAGGAGDLGDELVAVTQKVVSAASTVKVDPAWATAGKVLPSWR